MKQSGLGIASLVLGIIGLCLSCVIIGIVPCAIGLILAIVGLMQKDRGHGTAIAGLVCSVIGIGVFLLEVFILGASSDNSSVASNVSPTSETTAITELDADSENSEQDLASQMSINEYSMENTIGDTYYILIIKNNSSETVELNVNAVAKDGSGKTIGAASSSENAVESGQEVCLLNYFDGVTDADTFEYTLSVKKDKYYDSVYSDLTVEESRTDEKVILTVTNNGSAPAQFVEAQALFFSNGELVYFGSTYITDDESEIKAGATIAKEIDCYMEYDDVKVYFSGRK
ncbi:MAG: DUF4190 domain-containing protein [Lachnospiraceae bacterium]|nr:DUF4190 domain-containing protein [Lachnospiraceae bacterium]